MSVHFAANPLPNARTRPARDFRMQQIWETVQRRAQLILLTTLCVVLLATVYVLQVRPQYSATSEVMLDPRKSSVETTASVLSNLPVDQPTILNQVEVLTSHRMAGKVVDHFHLEADPEFAAPGLAARLLGTDLSARETAIKRLREKLKVAQAGFSSSIRITMTSGNREKAVTIAAGIAELYVQEQLETKKQASRQASQWLTQRVSELAQQVKEAEAAVQKYKADHRISITSEGTSVTEQQLAELNAQLTAARTDYDDKAAKAGRTDALLRSGQIATAPQVLASPVIATMRAQQSELTREIANLATKYGPNHPKMKELTAQRAELDAKISQETMRIAEGVRNEAETSRTHVASLQKSLHEIEDTNAKKNQDTVELTALQSAAASARAMYQAFLSQYSQTENQQGILRPDAFVISASDVSEAFGPQTKILAILSAVPAGLLLGLALAFMAERGDAPPAPARTRTAAAAGAATAILPEAQRAADLVISQPHSPYAIAISQLLSDIVGKASPPLTIAITSPTAKAGKTTVALSLARAAAKAGIAAIAIDANYPGYHLATQSGSVALALPQTYVAVPDCFINPDRLSPALIMAPDPQRPGYEQLLAQPLLSGMIESLKSSLELMIIVAPPLTDPLAASVMEMSDLVLVTHDARNPLRMGPVNTSRPILTVFTNAR